MSCDPAIEVHDLSKCYHIYDSPHHRLMQMFRRNKKMYREFWALRGANFRIERGETVGVVGRNGSGKSTLLQMICGTLTPTSGIVQANGRIAALLELGAGFNPEFTGRQNAILNAQILGLSRSEIEHKISEIEAFADIGEFFDQPVKSYSSGMYVRVAFAVQACVDPEILIVDEALAVGDAPFQAKCMARLKKLKERGTSILFVSHDVGAVREFCDRTIWIKSGRVVMDGDTATVTGSYLSDVLGESGKTSEPQNCITLKQTHIPLEDNLSPLTFNEDAPPISHWGSEKGCIVSCEMLNMDNQRLDSLEDLQTFKVSLTFRTPSTASMHGLGAAIAFRTLSGTDLLVSNTYDRGFRFPSNREYHTVLFTLDNFLNKGKYMLVATIEDRSEDPPRYYEFIEGVKYFDVYHSENYYGACIFPVEQSSHSFNISGHDHGQP